MMSEFSFLGELSLSPQSASLCPLADLELIPADIGREAPQTDRLPCSMLYVAVQYVVPVITGTTYCNKQLSTLPFTHIRSL